jgi:excisionase family DNA binding protein
VIDIAAEVSTALAPVLAELHAARVELAEIRAALPPRLLSIAEAAECMGISPQTVTAMCKRGELVHRRAGRRLLVSAESIRPADPARVAELAREARGL